MMEVVEGNHLLLILCSLLLFTGHSIEALPYDYSASIECLAEPQRPQYGGGIILNPEFNHGLKGWTAFGGGKIETRKSEGGNSFIVAHSRNQPYDSFSQKLYLQKGKLYTFSAWIQVSEGSDVPVTAVVKTTSGYSHVGAVVAESGCWSMLKGGLSVDSSGSVDVYFESKNTSVEIWVDNVSLQPFTQEQWSSHQQQSIDKARKSKVRFHAIDSKGKTLAGAKVSIRQKKTRFPFGSAINKEILTNTAYQNWFASRFTVTVFENEMKWYSTEGSSQGKVDYSVPDAMLAFAKQHGIAVRGHNIFWDDPKYQPWWVNSLSPDQLRAAAESRINSVVTKYAGQVTGWDVVNENLHFTFFEDKLGWNASAIFFGKAHQLDSKAVMFMNDYNTIEDSRDRKSGPWTYIKKLKEIMQFPGNGGPKGIGLEGHFKIPDIAYMRSAIDTLAATGLPIWLTEVDVENNQYQANYLEQILREAHAHPAVQGILMWAAWRPNGCYKMCLTDNNFKNLPTGNVVDKLINEWSHRNLVGSTDSNGLFETLLFHGEYQVFLSHPSLNSSLAHTFSVETTGTSDSHETAFHVQLSA